MRKVLSDKSVTRHTFKAVAPNLTAVRIRNTYNDPYRIYTTAFSH